MSKSLSEIDTLYKETISKQSKEVRLDYCNMVIDKAQFVLEKTRKDLAQNHKKELREKIVAAQNEVEEINREK